MVIKKPTLVLFLILSLLTSNYSVSYAGDFEDWLTQFKQEAIASGLSSKTVESALDELTPNESVIALDQKQPENVITFEEYLEKRLPAQHVREAKRLFEQHLDILHDVSLRYGVAPQVIVALWGMESNFGRNTGDYGVIESLATLAYEGRRAAFFRKELLSALKILEEERIPANILEGSWAGAMGQCQFMPSTYLRYAIDYDGDGHRDIWENHKDIFASIANYLAAEGWNDNLTWGREVKLTKKIAPEKIGLKQQRTLKEWQNMGVRTLNKGTLPAKALLASLIQPDGPHGRSFLVYDNFNALMRWNRSTYFGISVGLLADQITKS